MNCDGSGKIRKRGRKVGVPNGALKQPKWAVKYNHTRCPGCPACQPCPHCIDGYFRKWEPMEQQIVEYPCQVCQLKRKE